MKFSKIPENTFKNIQMNAGMLVTSFNPATKEVSGQLGATTGGLTFTATPTFSDYGEDIDNCPKNMKELKRIDSWEISLAGTFVTADANTAKSLIAAADVDAQNAGHIIPRNVLESADFQDIWWVGDYSDINTGDNAGYCAVHMMNVLNTGGFQIKSTDKAKGNFAFTYTAHYSMNAQDTVPFEVYILEGNEEIPTSILLDKHSITIEDEATATLVATTVPDGETVTWTSTSDSVVTVSGGVVTGEGAGNTIITASITVDGVTYDDTCTVIVTAKPEG